MDVFRSRREPRPEMSGTSSGLLQWYNLSPAVSHIYSVPAAQLGAVEPENAT